MRVDVVRLDAIEVVLGLRILHAENNVGVGLAINVGDAPIVPNDGDARCLASQPGGLRNSGP